MAKERILSKIKVHKDYEWVFKTEHTYHVYQQNYAAIRTLYTYVSARVGSNNHILLESHFFFAYRDHLNTRWFQEVMSDFILHFIPFLQT